MKGSLSRSTADVWLINLPGMDRRHEVYSMEQQMQDEANVRELITSITDSHEHDEMESLSFFFSLFPKERQRRTAPDSNISLIFSYLALTGRAQRLEGRRRPVLVQTRAAQGIVSTAAQSGIGAAGKT